MSPHALLPPISRRSTTPVRRAAAHRLRCAQVWGGVRGTDVAAVGPGIRASLFCLPSGGDRGGDVYYFGLCSYGALTRVALADVSGHGPAVAEMSDWMFDALKARLDTLDGRGVLKELNAMATARGTGAMTTAIVVAYYPITGIAYVASAGHHPPLLRRAGTRYWQPVELPHTEPGSDMPLGVDPRTPFGQLALPVGRGDQIVCYTDGVLDAVSPEGERFGLRRFMAVLDHAPLTDAPGTALKARVIDAISDFANGSPFPDDLTFIALEIQ